MSTTMTLSEVRTATRQRADIVNSQFITDSELNSYINQSYFELYDLLVQKYGDDYYSNSVTFATDGQSQFYALPNGTNYSAAPAFFKLLGVDLAIAPGNIQSYITIQNFNFQDRNRYAVPNFQSFYGVTNLRYRLNANNIWLTPIPAANQTIQLWYVPRLTTLSADADTVDGISGWTEYIIIDAAIKCMQKEESDCTVLGLQKAAMIARIEAAAENRNAAQPPKVNDTMYNDMWWPTGSGSGDGSGAF